jgi:hypothetical protein
MLLKLSACILLIYIIACSSKDPSEYPESFTDSLPKDSLAMYYHPFDPYDSTQTEFINSGWNKYASIYLYYFGEPILQHNGPDIFRFVWMRSFHNPMIFTIKEEYARYILRIKKFDNIPQKDDIPVTSDQAYHYKNLGHDIDTGLVSFGDNIPDTILMIRGYFFKPNLEIDTTIILSNKDYRNLENLLTHANFWTVPSFMPQDGTDGSGWVFEYRKDNRYKFLFRHSPQNEIFEIGKWLVEISRLDEELY